MTAILTNPTTTVSVRGFAEVEVPPDFAHVNFNVQSTADDADEALADTNAVASSCRDALDGLKGVRSSTLSRVRVRELSHWDKKRDAYISDGFSAVIGGTAELDVAEVGRVISALVEAGAQVSWLTWDIDADNDAYRDARKLAVADAHRAAIDFADAVDVRLGPLVTLADPGLLGAGAEQLGHDALYSAASTAPNDPEELDLDPEPQQVRANVEACFLLA